MDKTKIIEAMIEKPEEQPEALRPLFSKLKIARAAYTELNGAIAKTQESLSRLYSEREKTAGAGEVVLELITEALPDVEAQK